MATVQRTGRGILTGVFQAPSMPTLLLISALAIGAAALIPLVVSSIATSTSGNVHRLEQQRDDWQARIQGLELEVASMAGLDRIEREARTRLNMVEPQQTVYIAVPSQPPEPRSLPARYLPRPAQERQAEPGIWQQILGWLPLP